MAPALERQQSYVVFEHSSIEKQRNAMAGEAASLLSCSVEDGVGVLKSFRWNVYKMRDYLLEHGRDATFDKCGMWAKRDSTVVEQKAGGEDDPAQPDAKDPDEILQCQTAYCDEVKRCEGFELQCGHFFCNDCWEAYLDSQMGKGPTAIETTCCGIKCTKDHNHGFGCACSEPVPASLFRRYLDPLVMIRFDQWEVDSYVSCVQTTKWCPRPGCNYVVSYSSGGSKEVSCKCGRDFCYSCSNEPHRPVPCDLFVKWKAQVGTSGDQATAALLAATTKECPKCKVLTTKDKHCSHMHCSQCGFDYCWMCKGPWSGHNDYYNCSTYKDNVDKGVFSDEEKKQIDSNRVLQKFLFHNTRFEECGKGVIEADKLIARVEKEAQDPINAEYNPCYWLIDAIKTLKKAHHILQFSYITAYFLKKSGVKTLFERHQADLAAKADRLHERIECHTLAELSSMKGEIKNEADNILATVQSFSNNSEIDNQLQYDPDDDSSAWSCTACTTINDDMKALVCKMCTACRMHGEPECRAQQCKT